MTRSLNHDQEFVAIARHIAERQLSPSQWAEIESCDMFQSDHYCGGFEALEEAFCFSFLDTDDREWWFQISLDEALSVAKGHELQVELCRPPT